MDGDITCHLSVAAGVIIILCAEQISRSCGQLAFKEELIGGLTKLGFSVIIRRFQHDDLIVIRAVLIYQSVGILVARGIEQVFPCL